MASSYMPSLVWDGPDPASWTGVETSYAVVVTAQGTAYSYTVTVFDGITPNTPTCDSVSISYVTPFSCAQSLEAWLS